MDIIVEHVRSFSERQVIPLKPLTLLVGENSSGKSTFLAVVSAMLEAWKFPSNPGFNDPPYSLGSFDTIVTWKSSKQAQDRYFSVGFSAGVEREEDFREVLATYGSSKSGTPILLSLKDKTGGNFLDVNLGDARTHGRLSLANKDGTDPQEIRFDEELPAGTTFEGSLLHLGIDRVISPALRRQVGLSASWETVAMSLAMNAGMPPYVNSFSFAPIRSRPRRTYDEFTEESSPEGDHIPTLLAGLLGHEPASSEAERVRKALVRFGRESGLFKKIEVRKLGKQVGDPFQIHVSVAGAAANLMDVGYGVSQALPLVIQSVLKTTSNVLLMQQPEVHLHPRAQAALGSFFSDLVAHDDRMVLIETHSDYLLDRVRQEIANGTIAPDKVQILYFHKPELATKVHPINFDEMGNVLDAPPEYRSFFMEEERSLLFRGDK